MYSEDINFTDSKILRNKAEEKLKVIHQKESIPKGEAEMQKLVHELQVHQIELDLQNEELRQAYETAETALKKYTMLFDLSPMGYFTIDQEGTICDLNFTGADILKEKRFSLIGSSFKLFISTDSLPIFNNLLRKIYTSNAKESCEILLGYNNKPLCSVYIEGVLTEEDKKCLLSVVDIAKFNLQNKL